MATPKRRIGAAIWCVLVAAAAWAAAPAVASGQPGDGQRLQVDVYDLQTRTLQSIVVPLATAQGMLDRQPGPRHDMPANPKLLENPVVAARIRARAAHQPKTLNTSPMTQRLLGKLGRGRGSKLVSTYKMLVLLVDFSDKAPETYTGGTGVTHYNDMLFSTATYPTGSMKDYYTENSYGAFTLQGAAVGGGSGWYRAPQTYAYYVNHEYGTGSDAFPYSYPNNCQKLVEDLATLADADVDFSQYDNDGDGYVDGVNVVHPGQGAEETGNLDDIWSHQWQTSVDVTVDGVKVSTYSIMPENGSIGVFCHEFGHVLGAVDLYDYGYDSSGLGHWSVMAGGSWGAGDVHPERPFQFDAFHKLMFGWVSATQPTSNAAGVSFPAVETTPTIYRLWRNGDAGDQYFLVENRQKIGFDADLPGSGLAVYHVDEGKLALTRVNDQQWFPGMNPANHYAIALEQADGRWDLEHYFNRCDAGDLWSDGTGAVSFSRLSSPDSNAYNLGKRPFCGPTGVTLSNISASGATMTADVAVTSVGNTTWYVRADGSPLGSGLSPESAINAIQPAIDNALSGDTVIVGPGVYHENLDFAGRDITVTSSNPEDPAVVAATVLAAGADGYAVTIANGESSAAVLAGFTITRSYNTYGAGIFVAGASPTIRYCVVRDQVNDSDPGLYAGGGIVVYTSGDPLIEHNTIRNCSASWGGGIYLDSATATITDNVLQGNRAANNGGGIYIQNPTGTVALVGNTFRNNSARRGGGLACYGATLGLSSSTFRSNNAYLYGGAIFMLHNSGGTISNSTFSDNVTQRFGGGGICCWSNSSPTIDRVSIDDCEAAEGGGIYADSDCNPLITTSIITGAARGGGIFSDHDLGVTYCDVWGNPDGSYLGGMSDPTGINGNISLDPQYAVPEVGNLFLKSKQGRWVPASETWVRDTVDSPCIDAGDPLRPCGTEPRPNGDRLNMGAQGGTELASKSSAGSMIQSSTPAQGATSAGRHSPITIYFRWPVVQGSAEDHFTLTSAAGAVEGTFTWTTAFRVMKFQPNADLVASTNYTVTLASGIRKRDDTIINWSEMVSFRTGTMPVVTLCAPKNSDVATTAVIRVAFDRDMHKASVEGNLTVSPAVSGSFSWPTAREVVYTPAGPLATGTTYTVTVGKAARSLAGVSMGAPFSWQFSTVAAAPVVAAASATSVGDGAQITVNLSAAADVQVTICNLAGVAVAAVPSRALQSGVSTLAWNGRSASGSKVPGGRYLIRIRAAAGDGTTANVLVPLQR